MPYLNRSPTANPARFTYGPKDIVAGYAELVRERVDEGWEPTFLTFMFNPLGGSPVVVADAMRLEIERVYGWMLTRRCRRPKTTPNDELPILMACPDWPVPKYHRTNLGDVSINDGRHLHGIDLTPPSTRLVCSLSDFIADEQAALAGPHRALARIHAETVRHTPERAVQYVLKSLTRGRATVDDLIILPRSKSEGHQRGRFKSADEMYGVGRPRSSK